MGRLSAGAVQQVRAVDSREQQLLACAFKMGERRDGRTSSRNGDQVLTIEELALYLKIGKSTLYKLSQEGRIPAQKVGRHWRFRKDAIDRWLGGGASSQAGERSRR